MQFIIKGYNWCGPGTDVKTRLARGDCGINKLDEACKTHDIAYSNCKNSKDRHKADRILTGQAFERIYSKDSDLKERAAAVLVTGLMSTKMALSKVGLGLGKKSITIRKNKSKKPKSKVLKKSKKNVNLGKPKKKLLKSQKKIITFNAIVKGVKNDIKKNSNGKSLKTIVQAAVKSAKQIKKNRSITKVSRILKVPKFGSSIHSILPLLTSLSAIGSITSSAVGIAKVLKDIEMAKKELAKDKTSGEKKVGFGLSLVCNGSGFYLKPANQNKSD